MRLQRIVDSSYAYNAIQHVQSSVSDFEFKWKASRAYRNTFSKVCSMWDACLKKCMLQSHVVFSTCWALSKAVGSQASSCKCFMLPLKAFPQQTHFLIFSCSSFATAEFKSRIVMYAIIRLTLKWDQRLTSILYGTQHSTPYTARLALQASVDIHMG